MAPKTNTVRDSLHQSLMETYCPSATEDANAAILCAAGEKGYKHLDSSAYLGIDNLQSTYSEAFPDGSVRRIIETEHLDGSKDTQIRYLDPLHMRVLGAVDTHTANGQEAVVKVTENVSGSIDLKEGDTRPAPKDESSAAGLVPNSWSPTHDSTDSHDSSDAEHPASASDGNGAPTSPDQSNPYGNCPGVINYQNSGPDHSFVETGTSRSCTEAPTAVTVEDDQGSLRAFDSVDGFNLSSPSSAQSGTGAPAASDALQGEGHSVGVGEGESNGTSNSGQGEGTSSGSGTGGGDDEHDEPNGEPKEETPTTDEKGDMPNPDDGGGSPNSTPNPEGDGDDGENGHHGPPLNQGSNVAHLSTQLAAVGNSQDGAASDGYHGPRDPGEEMPDPDSNGGGNPNSNVAHGATSFWDQAVSAMQGEASGQHLSASETSAQASQSPLAFDAAAANAAHDTASHDIASTLSDTAVHAAVSGHDFAMSGASLHGELGTASLHDALTLSSGSFATQMHV